MNASAGWLLFALAGGMALAVQAGLNGGLGRLLGHPLWATLASLTVSAVNAARRYAAAKDDTPSGECATPTGPTA